MASRHDKLRRELARIAKRMPSGSRLEFKVEEDHLWLHILQIPKDKRGCGSRWLAMVLAAADEAGLPTALLADPTDEADDPATVDLVRWYRRFGFEPLGLGEDGVGMQREVQGGGVAEILARAQAAKRNDWTHADHGRWVEQMERRRRGPSF